MARKKEEPSILDLAKQHDLACAKSKIPKPKGTFGTGNFKKKIASSALGIHPNQIKEAMAIDKKLGVSVEFKPDGRPVFDNSAHFRRYAKAHGIVHYGY